MLMRILMFSVVKTITILVIIEVCIALNIEVVLRKQIKEMKKNTYKEDISLKVV